MKHLTILLLAVMTGMAWGQDTIVPRTSNTGLVGKISSHQTYHVEYENLAGEPYISVKPDSGGMAYNFATKQMNILITAGVLEEFLADESLMDSVFIDQGTAMRDKSNVLQWGPRWISPRYPKTLPGLVAWIKRKYREK